MNRLSDENLRARRQLKLSRFVVYLILIFLYLLPLGLNFVLLLLIIDLYNFYFFV